MIQHLTGLLYILWSHRWTGLFTNINNSGRWRQLFGQTLAMRAVHVVLASGLKRHGPKKGFNTSKTTNFLTVVILEWDCTRALHSVLTEMHVLGSQMFCEHYIPCDFTNVAIQFLPRRILTCTCVHFSQVLSLLLVLHALAATWWLASSAVLEKTSRWIPESSFLQLSSHAATIII